MATKRLTDLTEASALAAGDVLHIVQNSTDKKITAENFFGKAFSVTDSVALKGLTFTFKKRCGVVTVTIGGKSTAAIATTDTATVPDAFKPLYTYEFAAYNGSVPGSVIPVVISSDGTIYCRTAVASGIYLRGSGTYIL